MPRSFRAASPLKRVSLLLLELRVVEKSAPMVRAPRWIDRSSHRSCGLASLWLVRYTLPALTRLFDRHYAGTGRSKAYASGLASIKSACWREDGAHALQ